MDAAQLPAAFAGATHRLADSGEPVKATQWKKDGDHPLVERYPIEKREYKGLLVVGPKEKYGLRFGDWIIEDADLRLYVVPGLPRVSEDLVEDEPHGSGVFRKVLTTLPSLFDEKYVAIEVVQP